MAHRPGPHESRFPSLYPRILLYLAIAFQLLASLAVAGVMFYFIAHLNTKGYSLPWMFYFLQGSALATIISVILLRGWSHFRGPIPRICSPINGILTSTWITGFINLVQAMDDTITRPCTTAYWGNGQGILVCSLYKILFVGAIVGMLSTLAVLIMDALAWNKMGKTLHKLKEREGLLTSAGTEYQPVWSDNSSNSAPKVASMEPMRDERM
jgi:hypothetical protein